MNPELDRLIRLAEGDFYATDCDRIRAHASDRWWHKVYTAAQASGASDILIESGHSQTVLFRINGAWINPMLPFPSPGLPEVLNTLKASADLDPNEHRLPQDGRMSWQLDTTNLDLRISCLPSASGESLVIRILDPQLPLSTPATLGIPDEVYSAWSELFLESPGLYLITGPTGSGKTTTLHSLLGSLDLDQFKVITAEDPVEYILPGAVQVAVNETAGLTFSSLLRSFLRHDPDIIVVGEIRDKETAATAVQAALSGHRVIATLHCADAQSAPLRLQQLGIKPWQTTECLQGVLAQRLNRCPCTFCTESPVLLSNLPGSGCRQCNFTGWGIRKAAFDWCPTMTSNPNPKAGS